ncbi:MAG: hypothetical protein ABIT01_12245 [Thermoanaerobaculia bacterium]
MQRLKSRIQGVGWRAAIAVVLFYLVRDTVLYVLPFVIYYFATR